MKKIFLLIISISFLSFVQKDRDLEKSKYFEGQIIYDIEYSPYSDNFPSEKLKELIGSKMVLTFKKGNYKKEYFSPSGNLVQQRYLSLKDEKSYARTNDSDTIIWLDITKHESKTTFEIMKDSTILNHPCRIIKTKSIVSVEQFKNKPFEIESVFKYAKDLPVNPVWYSNYYEDNFNEIIRIGKGIAIVSIHKGILWEQKIKLKSIIKRKVKDKEIKLNISKNTPLKKI